MPELQGIFQEIYDPALRALRVAGAGDAQYYPAQDFTLAAGTPALTTGTATRAWLMDGGSTESINTSVIVPVGWQFSSFDLFWYGVGTGDVRWQLQIRDLAAGDLVTEAATNTASTATAAVANALVNTNLLNAMSTTIDRIYDVTVTRLGGDAADTSTTDAGIVGLRVRRAL